MASKLLEQINTEKRIPTKLSDFIKIKHGFAFKGEHFSAQPTNDILVTPGNFAIGGGFKKDKFKYYDGPIPADYVLSSGDLIVTMTDLSVNTDTLGYSALVPNDPEHKFLHNQRVGLVQQIKEGVDLGYLYYLMTTREYQSYVVSTASGSTVRHTSPDRITAYEYGFPGLSTQKKIAEILSVYDRKIENNNKIIKNLELMAQTIFDEWFVKFRFPGYEEARSIESETGEIPEGWEVKRLGDVIELAYGRALKSEDRREGPYPVIGSSGIVGFNAEALVSGPGIVVGRKGNAGSIIWVDEDFFPIDTTFYVETSLPISYCYFLLKQQKFTNSDSAVPGLGREDARRKTVLVADIKMANRFNKLVSGFFLSRSHAEKENLLLMEARARLLAKLI